MGHKFKEVDLVVNNVQSTRVECSCGYTSEPVDKSDQIFLIKVHKIRSKHLKDSKSRGASK